MGPRDRLDELLDGVDCAVCQASVPIERIRLLARRDDLSFVELDCRACGSVALAIVVADPDAPPVPGARRIDEADVERMRAFLDDYRGGLRELVSDTRRPPTRPAAHGA